MSTVINTNIAAIRTHNVYNRNDTAMNAALTRVATGMKINSAKDGASTWAISEKIRERLRANDQANQNVQNDTALVKTAQGGISNTIDILKTLKERAINAADDTNQNTDRQRIVIEVKELLNQMDDNTAKVKFNGRTLLDGTLAAASSSDSSSSSDPVHTVTAVTGAFADSDDNSHTGTDIVLRYMTVGGAAVADSSFNSSATLDVSVNGNSLGLSGITGSKTLGDLITAINNASDDVEAQYVASGASGATLTDPDGNTVKAADGSTDYTTTAEGLYFVSKDGGSATVTFTPSAGTFSLSPAAVSGLYDGTVTTYTQHTLADGAVVSDEDVLSEIEVAKPSPANGETLDFSTVSSLYADNAGTAFTANTAVLTYDDGTGSHGAEGWYNDTGADINVYTKDDADSGNTSGLTFYVGGETGFDLTFNIESMKVASLFGMSISKVAEQFSTSSKAQGVIDTIDIALNKALDEQTKLGAWENRLGYTSDNLVTMNENLEAADSVMRDADLAKEMTNYMKYSVLSQAAQYMLAQSGQNAFSVLNLLQQ